MNKELIQWLRIVTRLKRDSGMQQTELRANSKLKASEYSVLVLGLIFLRYADHKFSQAEKELVGKGTGQKKIGKSKI